MLYYEDILFSLYEIKEYAELMNKYVKDENIVLAMFRISHLEL